MRLAGKIGIVTAAASGMGRAGALRFAREGAQVAVVDVDAAGVERVVSEITAQGGTAHGIVADLTKDEESRRIGGRRRRFEDFRSSVNACCIGGWLPSRTSISACTAIDLKSDGADHDRGGDSGDARPRRRQLAVHRLDLGAAGLRGQPGLLDAQVRVVGFVRAPPARLAPEKIRVNAVCPAHRHADAPRSSWPGPTRNRPLDGPGGPGGRLLVRRLGAAGPHRPARGDRQRGALPPVRRGLTIRDRRPPCRSTRGVSGSLTRATDGNGAQNPGHLTPKSMSRYAPGS